MVKLMKTTCLLTQETLVGRLVLKIQIVILPVKRLLTKIMAISITISNNTAHLSSLILMAAKITLVLALDPMVLLNTVLELQALVIMDMAHMDIQAQACTLLQITTILSTRADFRFLKISMVTQTCQIRPTECQCLTTVTLNSLDILDIMDTLEILGTVR